MAHTMITGLYANTLYATEIYSEQSVQEQTNRKYPDPIWEILSEMLNWYPISCVFTIYSVVPL